ncbi:MAG TPA: Asp-tRNA(Asn)/Glu-tRNA(Gln) amidotransferase subunit GatB [Bacteroidetes bacterium]|nr:Asp-tRNA(Asn)/Glu-tRNA(Gln) amidotransferase subunit GatB [Bacteroidota bacterium]
MKYEAVIGLEVHAQLKTESKIFCSCSAGFGADPNSQACPICMGMPGVLPVVNEKAVEFAIKAGCATHCTIADYSVFARKNYFYPDLPKGYQISQFEEPICSDGYVEIEHNGDIKKIGLIRIHLEEDAGKSVHAEEWVPEEETLVDLNRCGVPLIEIVSQPDIRSPREATLYLAQLKRILEYLEISDCNMEEGSLRCDANISLRPVRTEQLGTKTELKNMNSFKSIEKALDYEITRQTEILNRGEKVQQQTLLWNADENRIEPMRTKEESDDYRYFPDPDLVPLYVTSDRVAQLQKELPELAVEKKRRFMKEFELPAYDAEVLTASKNLAGFFEETVALHANAKAVSNFVMGEVNRYLSENKKGIEKTALTPEKLAQLLDLIESGAINLKTAKLIFPDIVRSDRSPEKIVKQRGLAQVSDESELRQIVQEVVRNNPNETAKYLAGKIKVMGFLVGRVMRATRGKGNPKMVNQLLLEELNKRKHD